MTRPQLALTAFLDTVGHHDAAWRRPGGDPARSLSLAHYVHMARVAEAGLFDAVFLADNLAFSDHAGHRAQSPFEPLTLLSALATSTTHVGLAGTASTTYTHPFTLARQLSSLDHLSGGRAGWNVVTSAYRDEAANFGSDERADHATRYARAAEFLQVATALWDSWRDDAVVADVPAGRFVADGAARPVHHDGEFFSVRGPLTGPRPPQGRPVLVQAGASEDGRAFAARWAEVVFTAAPTLDDARGYYADVKRRAAEAGRDPDALVVLPGLSAVVAPTEAEARDRQAVLDELVLPEYGLPQLEKVLDADLSGVDVDGPLPPLPARHDGMQSRARLVVDLARREGLTVRRLVGRLAGARGHLVVVGTPAQVADEMEHWLRGGAADGFNLMPQTLPDGLEDFVRLVVPELQRRGLHRTAYRGTTLREHLGLPRPT
jgi:FMN-dependent oxidoreductase (nitrilotriacetate monooxygenase family)